MKVLTLSFRQWIGAWCLSLAGLTVTQLEVFFSFHYLWVLRSFLCLIRVDQFYKIVFYDGALHKLESFMRAEQCLTLNCCSVSCLVFDLVGCSNFSSYYLPDVLWLLVCCDSSSRCRGLVCRVCLWKIMFTLAVNEESYLGSASYILLIIWAF